MAKAAIKETNNHMQGRSGSGTKKNMGPVKNASGNPTSKGGINRPTRPKR